MIITEKDYSIEVKSDLFWFVISKPIISNTEIITTLMLGFPKDITEIIIEKVKDDNLKTKMYILTLEYEIKKMFNRFVIYYKDESDLSEIFAYDPHDYDISYGEYWSYIDYDSDNFSLDLDYSD